MELREYLALVRRWWWLLTLCLVLGGTGALVAKILQKAEYEASTTILVNQAPGALPDAEAVLQGQRVSSTYAELMRQRPVLEQVIANLGLPFRPEELERKITITPIRDTNLIELSVRDEDPYQAANIANEIVNVFVEQNIEFQASRNAETLQNLETELATVKGNIDSIETQLNALGSVTTPEQQAQRDRLDSLLAQYRGTYASLLSQYEEVRLTQAQTTDKLSIVTPAVPDGTPVGISLPMTVLLGMMVGVFVGGGIALLLEYLDDTIKSPAEAETLIGAPGLGIIGEIDYHHNDPDPVTASKPRSPIAESFRVLRANVEFVSQSQNNGFRKILVTSSSPAEGKTTVAANLAVALAQSGRRVLLVDADLRRPALHKYFGCPNSRGLTTLLLFQDKSTLTEHIQSTRVDNLYLLTSGPLPPNPADLLQSPRMTALFEQLTTLADIVLVDGPPLLVVADAALLARNCDGVLMVVLPKSTRANALLRAKAQIEYTEADVLGFVFNRVDRSSDGYYYNAYYYSGGSEDS